MTWPPGGHWAKSGGVWVHTWERKASWHLVGVGTHPSTCRTGPVNRPIHPKPKHREPREARGDYAGAADTPSPVTGAEGSASLHQGHPRSHRSPVWTQGNGACVHTSLSALGGGWDGFSDTRASPSPGGLPGADGLGMEVGWGVEAGEKAHLSPHRVLTHSPLLCAPPQTARSPPASRWFGRRT